jgi:colanic acid biosynthesis glycosyl transferase WcaI
MNLPEEFTSSGFRRTTTVARIKMVEANPDVLLLALNFPPEHTGIAPYTGALAVGLSEAGFQVRARVAHPHYPEWKVRKGYGQWRRTERLDGVEVQRLLHYVPRVPRGVRRLLSELSFGSRLMVSRIGRPQVVVTVSPPLFSTALVVLRLQLTRRRPQLVVWVQDIYTLGLAETGEGGRLTQRVTKWVESYALRAADVVVVIHERFREFVTEELGVASTKVVVVRNWTHLPRWEPVERSKARATLDWPPDVTLAVHTGNMGAKQGLENVVEAARLADERGTPVHFVLLGDGGERRALEECAKGITRLSFIDPLSDSDYPLALAAADVLIVNEKQGVGAMAVPSKLTSYFAAGRPVVAATDPNGITAAEVLAANSGVVVAAGDPCALLAAVSALGMDSEAAERYGLNGRKYRESVLDQRQAIAHWKALIGEATRRERLPWAAG